MSERQTMPVYLRRLIDSEWHPSPGEVVEVDVRHASDCGHWRGDPCTCNPTVDLTETPSTRNRKD